MQTNAEKIERFTTGLTQQTFEASDLTVYAVTRALEIISAVSRRLPDEMRSDRTDLPWQQIMSAGDVYRHEYDRIAPARVRETVQDHLPRLKAFVEQQLRGAP